MLKRTLLAPIALCALAFSATVAHADPPMDAAGTWDYYGLNVVDMKEAGNTTFLYVEIEAKATGTMDGDVHEEYTVVVHTNRKTGAPTSFTYRGVATFAGCVYDHCGTLRLVTHGRADPGQDYDSRWVITGGDGALKGLSGHATGKLLLDPPPGEFRYEGQVHFRGR